MNEIPAIYENGVFKPITPLALPEMTRVRVTVDANSEVESGPESLRQSQQAALNAMFAAVDLLPQVPSSDGRSGRDHDQILYGSPK
jgi:predicted DNA-binding antitoxin AbrB/MazE fold protein